MIAAVGTAASSVACGGPCKEVAAARATLSQRPAVAAEAPHARVRVPFAAANRAIAEVLADEVAVPVPLGRIGRLGVVRRLVGDVEAVPRSVRLGPAGPGRVRVDVTIEVRDGRGVVLTFDAHAEVAPVLERADGDVFLGVGLDPRRIEGVELEVGPRFTTTVRGLLAARAVEELGEEAWKVVRAKVLPRVESLTRMRVRLPDVPVERVVVTSVDGAVPAVDIAIMTSLPVRAGLAPASSDAAGDGVVDADAVDVRLAGSTVAELANWAIATGRAPQRYTRKLEPRANGDYVPLLDWRPGHARPLVVSIFQVARGCSCFSAGVRARVEVRGDDVIGTIEERRLELALGPPHLETLAWLKDAVDRSIRRSKRAAAHTELRIGDRVVGARLVDADVDRDELHVAVHLAVGRRVAAR